MAAQIDAIVGRAVQCEHDFYYKGIVLAYCFADKEFWLLVCPKQYSYSKDGTFYPMGEAHGPEVGFLSVKAIDCVFPELPTAEMPGEGFRKEG